MEKREYSRMHFQYPKEWDSRVNKHLKEKATNKCALMREALRFFLFQNVQK